MVTKTQQEEINESVMGKVLKSQVGQVVAIIIFLAGVFIPYFDIKQHIALIDQSVSNINVNHEVHIQDLTQNIKDLQTELKSDEAILQKNQEQIIRLLTLLKQ